MPPTHDASQDRSPATPAGNGYIDLGPPQTLGEDAACSGPNSRRTIESKERTDLDHSGLAVTEAIASPSNSQDQEEATRDSDSTSFCGTNTGVDTESEDGSTLAGGDDDEAVVEAIILRMKDSVEDAKDGAAADVAVEGILGAQEEKVAGDLPWIYPCKSFFYDRLYEGTTTNERIDAFLRRCPLYDQKKNEWIGIHPCPDLLTSEKPRPAMVEAMAKIISAIVEGLGAFSGRRYLMTTVNVKLFHSEDGWHSDDNHFSSPTFVIAAEGPSFERPQHDPQGVGFTNITTCIDVITDPRVSILDNKVTKKHAIYARQMFIQQPNRRFIRTFAIDRHSIHFFHFDRSGIHHGIICGYHKHNVHAFIRLILGLCSLNEEVLGLDSSLQWSFDTKGRKVRGTLTIMDHDTKVAKKYDLHAVRPMFLKRQIQGPGTVCWLVQDHENKRLLIVKDNWRLEHSLDGSVNTPEYEQLKKGRNLEGVAQMITYEADRVGWETKDLGVMNYLPPGERHTRFAQAWANNRILSRVVTELYGQDISHFESEKQLLCALRDAIGGHRNLYLRAHTLHRDIAWQNIVLGKPRAPQGQQGILIDLDLAKPIAELEPETHGAGHCFFLSIALLANVAALETGGIILPHDYLDDLQSTFYVLASLMYHYDGRGNPQVPIPSILEEWVCYQEYTFQNCIENLKFKKRFILSDSPVYTTKQVGETWSKASRNLLQKFYTFTREIAVTKEEVRKCEDGDRYDKLLEEDAVRQNYDRVLQIFDTAITELDTELQEEAKTTSRLKRKASGDPAVNSLHV